MSIFKPADILLPRLTDLGAWSVIACDQFTSDPAYWYRVKARAQGKPSTYNLILPEAQLGTDEEEPHTARINRTMQRYLSDGLFYELKNSYIYIERTLDDGTLRKGLVGMVDLEDYDFRPDSTSAIRATEKTVLERIPPRVRVRREAPLEFPHIIMLLDDDKKVLIEPVTAAKDGFRQVYDFDLMEGGGHISGWLVDEASRAAFDDRFAKYSASVSEKYQGLDGVPMILAAGDGNHSLATAKTCYEELKAANPGMDFSNHPARYALVELNNIHDEAQKFEPIHRIVTACDPQILLRDLKEAIAIDETDGVTKDGIPAETLGFPLRWYSDGETGLVYLDKKLGQLTVGILQSWLDDWLGSHKGEVDYIHDDDALIGLASRDHAVGFLLPAMEKGDLFRGVIADGALPRKTFSMGHSHEKRYYLEGRKIR